MKAIKGNIIYTDDPSSFKSMKNAYILYNDTTIIDIVAELPNSDIEVKDYGDALIIPGFYDLHVHGSQFPQCGVGMNKQLLYWLNDYTYNLEMKYTDPNFAKDVYDFFTQTLIDYGTLGAAVYATTDIRATDILHESFNKANIRGYIGKVSMVRNGPEEYIKTAQENYEDTLYLIEKYNHHPLVKPIITPRFVPTSTEESLKLLGQLALDYNVPVQSHINENLDEIKWVSDLYKEKNYATVYHKYNLYGQTKTLMAHGVYMSDDELRMTKDNDVILVHCPDSNINICSGIMPVRHFLNQGIKIGIGTDCAGGHKISMTEALVRTIQLSKIQSLNTEDKPLAFSEAFHMATAVGGNFFGKCGKLKKGYQMDCLVIDDHTLYKSLYNIEDRLEKFVYTGDDRWIKNRYVAGKKLK